MQRHGWRQWIYNYCFLWANCEFLILKFVFLMGELWVSYFEICVSCGRTVSFLFWNLCFLWAKCPFLILEFVFLIGERNHPANCCFESLRAALKPLRCKLLIADLLQQNKEIRKGNYVGIFNSSPPSVIGLPYSESDGRCGGTGQVLR